MRKFQGFCVYLRLLTFKLPCSISINYSFYTLFQNQHNLIQLLLYGFENVTFGRENMKEDGKTAIVSSSFYSKLSSAHTHAQYFFHSKSLLSSVCAVHRHCHEWKQLLMHTILDERSVCTLQHLKIVRNTLFACVWIYTPTERIEYAKDANVWRVTTEQR